MNPIKCSSWREKKLSRKTADELIQPTDKEERTRKLFEDFMDNPGSAESLLRRQPLTVEFAYLS